MPVYAVIDTLRELSALALAKQASMGDAVAEAARRRAGVVAAS